jgi:O-antigen/teichoic acid export membrane protein
MRRLSSRVLAIAAGEGVARVCNLLLMVFIARVFGVKAAGAYALALTVSLYLAHGTDFGLRHAGARLTAQHPKNYRVIVRFIQHRRMILAVLLSAAGCAYGAWGPVPSDARRLVSLYAIASVGYGFSVDWLAWGTQRFSLMSGWRALVSLIAMGITIGYAYFFHGSLLIIPLACGIAYVLADSLLWFGWARKLISHPSQEQDGPALSFIPEKRATLMLGAALLLNQAFNSIDTLLLGGLTSSSQTGLYSAAYRILLLVLALYYLGMQALYPQLAATPKQERKLKALRRPILIAAAVGVAAATIMMMVRRPLIALMYGPAFAPSAALATPLLFAIPLDFVTSVFMTVMVAWDHSRQVLIATITALTSNVLMNLYLIPRYGAMGAAYATPLSYIPFLIVLVWQMRNASGETHKQTPLENTHQDRVEYSLASGERS